jgi:hypothetical protein
MINASPTLNHVHRPGASDRAVLSAAIMALSCLALGGCHQTSQAAAPAERYRLVVDANGSAWRLDSVTGETKRCWPGNPGVTAPTCVTATQE